MAVLTSISGVNVGRVFELNNPEMLIGRDPLCEVSLPMRTVSRRHARVGRDDAGFFIEDLGSVNGTFVNGNKLDGRIRLNNQDRIRIGQNILLFVEQNADDETVMLNVSQLAAQPSTTDTSLPAAVEKEPPILSTLDVSSPISTRAELNPQAKLLALLEITQSLGSSLKMDDVLPSILDSLFRIFPQAAHGYILQSPAPGKDLEPLAIKHRVEGASDTISPLGGPIVSRVMTDGTAFLSGPASDGDEDSVLDERVRSVMCAPLMGPSRKPLGVIHLDTENPRQPFSQIDLDVLVSVATVAGQAVEYARMHSRQLELEGQRRDLSTAKDVQLHFLPKKQPELPGYHFCDYYRAAATVAGDYYDYIKLPDGRLAVALGDVSGKGIPAALLMARLCSDVRYSLLSIANPPEAVNWLNSQLSQHLEIGRFITFVLFVLDVSSHKVTIVNAGHTPPLLRRAATNKIEAVACDDHSGMPLGIRRKVSYPHVEIPLSEGDLLLAYTDGVNEALNEAGEQFSNPRVHQVFRAASTDAAHVGRALVEDVRRFAAGYPQSDDICLLCFGRKP